MSETDFIIRNYKFISHNSDYIAQLRSHDFEKKKSELKVYISQFWHYNAQLRVFISQFWEL